MTMRCPMRANMAGELAACDHECAWYVNGKCGVVVQQTVERSAEPDGMFNNTDEDVTDSREKLEADVQQRAECSWVTAPYEKVIEWLDRQAAITANEYEFARKLDSEATVFMRKKNDELRAKVNELESENAKLSSDELHWRNETEHWRSMYETISKALDDVLRIRGGVAS